MTTWIQSNRMELSDCSPSPASSRLKRSTIYALAELRTCRGLAASGDGARPILTDVLFGFMGYTFLVLAVLLDLIDFVEESSGAGDPATSKSQAVIAGKVRSGHWRVGRQG